MSDNKFYELDYTHEQLEALLDKVNDGLLLSHDEYNTLLVLINAYNNSNGYDVFVKKDEILDLVDKSIDQIEVVDKKDFDEFARQLDEDHRRDIQEAYDRFSKMINHEVVEAVDRYMADLFSFETIDEMVLTQSEPDADPALFIPEGFIAYCQQTGRRYEYFEEYEPGAELRHWVEVKIKEENLHQSLLDRFARMEEGIATNAENIATNAENIAINAENIAINAENIAINKEDIATNKEDIVIIKEEIVNIKEDANATKERLTKAEEDIVTNAESIKTLEENINTKLNDYATKASVEEQVNKINETIEQEINQVNDTLKSYATIEYVDDALKDVIINEGPSGGSSGSGGTGPVGNCAYFGEEEPEDDEQIWFSGGVASAAFDITMDNPIINELFACIRTLQDQVKKLQEEVEYLKINGGGSGSRPGDDDEPDDPIVPPEEPEVIESYLELEEGGIFLFEDGTCIMLEESEVKPLSDSILELEDGGRFLMEDGSYFLLEIQPIIEEDDILDSIIVLENGGHMLMENGARFILETSVPTVPPIVDEGNAMLLESGAYVLYENGNKILLER